MYSLKFTDQGLADVKDLPKGIRNALKKALQQQIATDPARHSVALNEPLGGFRSFHWGKYRVILRIFEDLRAVAIVGVGLRDASSAQNIYRRLESLAQAGKLAENILISLQDFVPKPRRSRRKSGLPKPPR